MRKHTKYHHISGSRAIRCYLIALVLSLPFTVEPSIASPEQPGLVITHHYPLNIRSGPGIGYPVIGKAEKNSILTVSEAIEEWYHVKSPDGTVGYAFHQYIKVMYAETCIRFGGNTYDVCWSGDQITHALARGRTHDAKGYGGYYDHPYLVIVFAKPQESGCSSSQTYFMELLGTDNVKLNRWVDKCGRTQEDGTIYHRSR